MLRWPRPRFRVRTLFVLAAVACLALGFDGMRKRRAYCLDRVEFHRYGLCALSGHQFSVSVSGTTVWMDQRQLWYRHLRAGRNRFNVTVREPTETEWVTAEDNRARVSPHYAWHLEWARRLERAASRPWEAVPIVPPEPGHLWNPADCRFWL